jgi:general L-amino acid transport system substrate-binding protein
MRHLDRPRCGRVSDRMRCRDQGKKGFSMRNRLLAVAAAVAMALAAGAAHAGTLDDVKTRGVLKCGVSSGLPGFSVPDESGSWSGFDVDYCRAVAAAIFGHADAVEFFPLEATVRFDALNNGGIDMLARNTTWTMARDTSLGLTFTGISYFDGQGFMARKSLGIASALELSGAAVCVRGGTTTELNLVDYFESNSMNYTPVVFNTVAEVNAAYDSGRCDVYSADASSLYSIRLLMTNPGNHIVLPQIISKEPLGPVVRQGDDQWFNIVKWVHFALLNAEELGVSKTNVAAMADSENQDVRRLLGLDGAFGEGIGLDNAWAGNVIKAVGNYGEIFDRNIGADSDLGFARGLNALWRNGGLQYAPPIR